LARITLAAPQRRNVQSPHLWARLAAIGSAIPSDVRVVLLDAEGPSFSAGLDRDLLRGDLAASVLTAAEGADERIAGFQRGFTWLGEHAAVSVAAVAGHAVGAGFQLALACDLILTADDAQFAMREIDYGLIPDLGGTAPLVAAVGYPRALELCATGRWLEADEAVRSGLALAAVPRDDLATAAEDLVAALLAADAAALRALKPLLRSAAQPDQPARERQTQIGLLQGLALQAGGRGKDPRGGGVATPREADT
jgi:enoyl-CoA hydratase/carnithine racemase